MNPGAHRPAGNAVDLPDHCPSHLTLLLPQAHVVPVDCDVNNIYGCSEKINSIYRVRKVLKA
jgi:hypothetical protein